jgi:PAS domain S-box-containing protein
LRGLWYNYFVKFLLVDESPADRELTIRFLRRAFVEAEFLEVASPAEYSAALAGRAFDCVLTEYSLSWTDGLAVLRAVKELCPAVPVIMLTGSRDVEAAVAGMKLGLSDFVRKGCAERLLASVHDSLERVQLSGPDQANGGGSDTVPERMRAEVALRESEERYRQMFEKNRAVKLLIDPETGAIVQANPAASEFYGYSQQEWQHKKITDVNTLSPEQVFAEMKRAVTENRTYFTFQHKLASGELRDVAVYSSPLDIQGRRLLYSIIHDITDRRRAENAVAAQAERLRILHEIDRAVLAAKSPEEIALAALRRARQVVACPRVAVWLFDAEDCNARLLAADMERASEFALNACLPFADCGFTPGALSGVGHIVEELTGEADQPVLARSLYAEGIRSLTVLPLVTGGLVIGCLNFGMARPGGLPPEDLDFARQVADSLAVAIQDARLYDAERHAREVADTLRSATLALTLSLDLDTVLQRVLDNLARLVPYDTASVLLMREDNTMAMRALRGYENWTDAEQLSKMAFDLEATPTILKVFNDRQSLLIPDTEFYPGWRRTPGSEHIRSWLGVPLIAGGRVFGLCSLDMVRPDGFTEEHVRLTEALVAQAATALQNAQLFEEVRLGRTQLQVLSRRLVEVQETERRLIARELHDDAGQALAALMVGLKLLERDAADPEAVLQRTAELRKTADGVLDNLHRLAMDLRPASLDHLGLVPSLQQYTALVGRQSELSVRFEALGLDGKRLAPDVETNIFRIAQEALTNVIRHAHATQADVLLENREQGVLLIIEDNGIGFDYDEAARRGRLGLFGMRERAEMLGGHVVVETSPGTGTTVFVEVPNGH